MIDISLLLIDTAVFILILFWVIYSEDPRKAASAPKLFAFRKGAVQIARRRRPGQRRV